MNCPHCDNPTSQYDGYTDTWFCCVCWVSFVVKDIEYIYSDDIIEEERSGKDET